MLNLIQHLSRIDPDFHQDDNVTQNIAIFDYKIYEQLR